MFENISQAEELARFAALQERLPNVYRRYDGDSTSMHTAVVVPSLSLHPDELSKIKGVSHYEERLLFLLMVLRHPRTRVVFITSQALDPVIIDYYLNLLAGRVPSAHARRRLYLFHTGDASPVPLTQKILDRPRLMQRIQDAIVDKDRAHLACFNSTELERKLAVQLGVPLYAADPALRPHGTKSGARKIFKAAGVPLPAGFEDLQDANQIAEGISELWTQEPDLSRVVVKLNDGFSGAGNAIFRFNNLDAGLNPTLDQAGVPRAALRKEAILRALPTGLLYEAKGETWDHFREQYEDMGGVVEAWIEGDEKHSPSVQCRVDALGNPMTVSTHDQVLGGPSGQAFLGCRFPADSSYRRIISRYGDAISQELVKYGVIGRFGIDFIVVRREDQGWDARAIEINLRKGGTTHPFLTLKFLTDGVYEHETGEFLTPSGDPRYYFATDNLVSASYRGLLPEDLMDIAVTNKLHFHSSTLVGVTFHLIGALSEFGKLGVTAIGASPKDAEALYRRAISVLDRECGERDAFLNE